MSSFEIPSNIKQIGGIDSNLKIYVEDYAASYLKRLAESDKHNEKIAFLVGKHMVIDAQRYIFICGAIQGRFTELDEGCEVFSDDSYDYACEQLDHYFEGLEIIGWMQSQPGYGTGLNPVCADYHMNNFIKPFQVLMVIDPVERQDVFYSWDNSMSGIGEVAGYFIYYDRNRGMQEYMLDNRIQPRSAAERKALTTAKPAASSVSRPPSETSKKPSPSATPARSPYVRDPAEGVKRWSTSKKESSEHKPEQKSEYKKVINMLVSLSAVLFVICFIMGAGLIQSDGRISQLENDIGALNGTYAYLIGQITQIGTQPVYASGDDKNDLTTPNPTPTPSPSPTPIATEEPLVTTTQPTPQPTPTLSPTNTPIAANTPGPTEAAPASGAIIEFDTYTVQRGDTLTAICYRYYGSTDRVAEVMEFNNITDPDTIYFGKVIKLPKR